MKRVMLLGAAIVIMLGTLMLTFTGCFGSGNRTEITTTITPDALKPKPTVLPVVATTSGTEAAYYAVLDIKVKNEGAEGVVLVKASVTQNGVTNTNEMPVYLKNKETHGLKMTFPLVWKGGEFKSAVEAVVP
jgi:hypothetical protein